MTIRFFPKKYYLKNRQKGFALLIGVVVASVLVSITFVMFSISLKQISLSTTGKNSQYAFYAADTGIECALYADNKINKVFVDPVATVNGGNTNVTPERPVNPTPFICSNQTIREEVNNLTLIQGRDGSNNPTPVEVDDVIYSKGLVWRFTVDSPTTDQCAIVTVSKYVTPDPNVSNVEILNTKLESRGYNTCPTINPTDPQRVERGLEVYY
jgi:hypothetical protein